MSGAVNALFQGRSMITPAMLAELKVTLGDLPKSVYEHQTQTRQFPDGQVVQPLAPDTMFDGERS